MATNEEGIATDHRLPRERLTQERIVTETLALIDEQGIAFASMRNVGERLGVRAMSLYRYVGNRDELFDAVVDRIVNELSSDPDVTDGPIRGWRSYLDGLAWGVRRYARAHPHAFPLVATRPPGAPWVNPPLRSLRWIETMLSALAGEGFTDEQLLFTYRSFNSFLLGFLLLETSAMALRDPKPGDGSFQLGTAAAGTEAAESTDPVPGALSPTRSPTDRRELADATTTTERIDPIGEVTAERYPVIYRLREGLTEDRFEDEFRVGLNVLLDRIDTHLGRPSG